MITKICGLFTIGLALTLVYQFETSAQATGTFRLLHWPAIGLTGVGPFGLLLLCSDWGRIKRTFWLLVRGSLQDVQVVHDREAEYLQALSSQYYTQGARAFDKNDLGQFSPFLKRVVRRLAMRMPVYDVRS